MIASTQRLAQLYTTLQSPYRTEILEDLLVSRKVYSFFITKYGKTPITYHINWLVKIGAIKKILNPSKNPTGYEITDYGRRIYHCYTNFQRDMEAIEAA